MRYRTVLMAASAPFSITAAATLVVATPAAAQTKPAASPSGDGTQVSPDTNDIVVTAQKRAERLMDVPIAVTAVTGAEIEDKGYANVASLLNRAPGVSIAGGSVQIRGISSRFGAATVGYYLDELPFSFINSTASPDVRSWDLERVEILRGPQGTLYGANSTGGTIRILTKNPNLSRFEGKGEASIGSIEDGSEEWEVKGALNVPLVTDRIAIRLAGTHYENDGYIDSPLGRDINDSRITTLRGKLALAPFDGTRITLSAWSQDTDFDNNSNTGRNRLSTVATPTPNSSKFRTYGGIIEQEGPGFDIVSATSYLKLHLASAVSANLGAGVVTITSDTLAKTFSQEVRLVSSGSGPLRWTTGGFYQYSTQDTIANLPGFYISTSTDKSQAWAVFGEGSYRFGEVEATLGGRYYHDKRTSNSALSVLPPSAIAGVVGSYDTFNPKFSLSWHADPHSLFYATVSKGFRSGQNQPASSVFTAASRGITIPAQIAPETLWSYEVGNKSSFLDGKLTLETAFYYNDWKDLQVAIQLAGGVGALVNGGKAHAMGADLAIAYRPVTGLTLAVSGNVNESKFDTAVPTAFNAGDRIVNVPSYTFNASASYKTRLSDSLNFYAYGELQQTPKLDYKLQGLSGVSDPQSIVNGRIGVESKRWGVYLTVQNLFDEQGFNFPPLATTSFQSTIPQPRTIGVLLRANY
ncbi:MAG: TonB-dependent receptor [Bradyrhizobium sp.]|nr:TonB-dependent receptor [Bradyrhizobium sp.]